MARRGRRIAGSWKAEYPDGRVGYFGATAEGLSVDTARFFAAGGTFRYLLTSTVDVYGHEVRYTYTAPGGVPLVSRIDYLFDFTTGSDLVSPLTAIHKIDHLEANMIGTGLGDGFGRLFISQRGTATVEALDGTKNVYRFEPRTAVINPFFHSTKPPLINPQIYENERFRDRPFLNSEWLLGLDLHGEEVNRDIGLRAALMAAMRRLTRKLSDEN